MDLAGNLTTFYAFGGHGPEGVEPVSSLIEASDGNFYGTAPVGGLGEDCFGGCGTLFKLDAAGNATTLHFFQGTDGVDPTARLLQASDGDLYGTTRGGGQNSGGTIFKIDTSGAFTTLYSFPVNSLPYAGLIQASDGRFYGTTYGTVFRMDSSGNVTTLHTFTSAEDFGAYSELLQASDGNFYGTLAYSWMNPCPQSGQGNCGSIFRMDSSGNVTILHVFRGPDGAVPRAGLIQASDGSLYGTTSEGGPGNVGVVFRIDLHLTPPGLTATTRCDNPGGCRARP